MEKGKTRCHTRIVVVIPAGFVAKTFHLFQSRSVCAWNAPIPLSSFLTLGSYTPKRLQEIRDNDSPSRVARVPRQEKNEGSAREMVLELNGVRNILVRIVRNHFPAHCPSRLLGSRKNSFLIGRKGPIRDGPVSSSDSRTTEISSCCPPEEYSGRRVFSYLRSYARGR